MRKKSCSYGEYVVREGEIPEGLYILSKGQCMVCIESLGFRTVRKLPPSDDDPRTPFVPDQKTLKLANDLRNRTVRAFQANVLYQDDQGKQLDTHIAYHNLVVARPHA